MRRIPESDLWGDVLAHALVCSWIGHDYMIEKMSGRLCRRCRSFRRY